MTALEFNFAPRDARLIAFEQFHRANPHVYEAFKRFAKEARQRRDHFAARDIIHRIRWWTEIESNDADGFKINNNWSPFYARLLIKDDPTFAGFFELRRAAADREAA